MDRLFVRPRGIQVDMLDDLGLDDIGARRNSRLAAEIHFNHPPAGIGRSQDLHSVAYPARGRLREVEVAVDTVNGALAAERSKPLVYFPADRAEFRICGVAKGQEGDFDAIEVRRQLVNQM